jgi:hypothetical protein
LLQTEANCLTHPKDQREKINPNPNRTPITRSTTDSSTVVTTLCFMCSQSSSTHWDTTNSSLRSLNYWKWWRIWNTCTMWVSVQWETEG